MVPCPKSYEFAQQSTYPESSTAREDDILPYIGWVVIRPAKLQLLMQHAVVADRVRGRGWGYKNIYEQMVDKWEKMY